MSKKPKIVCADRFYMAPKAMKALEAVGEVLWSDAKSEEELIKELCGAVIVISEYVKITAQVLEASKKLKGVMVWGVGYDHVDINAASERGIYVANTKGSNAESVAEQTISFILALSRRVVKADAFVRSGDWTEREEASLPDSLKGNDVYGKTLGIIGLGTIGRRVATIAREFDMNILAYDPYVPDEAAKKIGVKLVSLQDVLRNADYVSIHTVLSEETLGLIGDKELALMKPSAYIINTSRGSVINQRALVDALTRNGIAGAALDVFEVEPLNKDNPLLKLENVIVSPHYAGNSREALEATSIMVSEEVARIVKGEKPLNLVNRIQLEELGFLNKSNW